MRIVDLTALSRSRCNAQRRSLPNKKNPAVTYLGSATSGNILKIVSRCAISSGCWLRLARRSSTVSKSGAASASSSASRVLLRRIAGGMGSIMTPPPSVRIADWSRKIKRSPCSAAIGSSRISCARPSCPGAIDSPRRMDTRAVTAAVARCRCTGVQCLSARLSPASTLS